MTLKTMIENAIHMCMKTFTVSHYSYNGRKIEQTVDTIFEFIKDYEDCIPVTCYFGTYYSMSIPHWHYDKPDHCHISYRLPNENLPKE